jgi:HK97 family phage prohead protease
MSSGSFDYKTTSLGTLESKSGSINLDEAQGIVECFVAGIGNKDSVGDIVTTGAFTKSLMRRKPRVVWGHNWNDPIGKVLEIYEVPPTDRRLPMKMKMAGIGGLFARVQFNLQSEKGREAFANIAFFGEEQEWSIGYKTLRAQYDQKSQANVIYELELYEVSPVLHGANQLTGTISVKSEESSVAMMMPMDDQMGEGEIDKEELQKQLSAMLGTKVSVMDVSDDEVTFARQSNGEIKKYKCHFGRNRGQFMFGPPKPLIIIAKPTSMPMGSPGMPISMPSGMPENEPRQIGRARV